MSTTIRKICWVVAVLMISSVSVVPAAANDAMDDTIDAFSRSSDTRAELSRMGISVTKIPDKPAGSSSTVQVASAGISPGFSAGGPDTGSGQQGDALLEAAIDRMKEQGYSENSRIAGNYEIAVPDELVKEKEDLEASVSSDARDQLRSRYPEAYAQMQQWESASADPVTHKDGKTLYRSEIAEVAFTNAAGQKTHVTEVRSLDNQGEPTGTGIIMSTPAPTSGAQNGFKTIAGIPGFRLAAGSFSASSGTCMNEDIGKTAELCDKYTNLSQSDLNTLKFLLIATVSSVLVTVYLNFVAVLLVSCLYLFTPYLTGMQALGFIGYIVLSTFLSTYSIALGLLQIVILLSLVIYWGVSYNISSANKDLYCHAYSDKVLATCIRTDVCNTGMAVSSQVTPGYPGQNLTLTSFRPASDGGYIATATRVQSDGKTFMSSVAKYNADGTASWSRDITGTTAYVLSDIRPTKDGYVAVGTVPPGKRDNTQGVVLGLDSTGSVLWTKTVEGRGKAVLSGVAISPEGNIYAAGATETYSYAYSGWTAKTTEGIVVGLNASGNSLSGWGTKDKPYIRLKYDTTSGNNVLGSIQVAPDGTIVTAGSTQLAGEEVSRGWLVAVNSSSGETRMSTTYSLPTLNTHFTGIQANADGSVVAAGNAGEYGPGAEVLNALFGDQSRHMGSAGILVAFDRTGTKIRETGLSNLRSIVLDSISPASDGGYLVAGSVQVSGGPVCGVHGGNDGWVLKVDKNLDFQWQKTLGESYNDELISAYERADLSIIAAGAQEAAAMDLSSHAWIVTLHTNPSAPPDQPGY